MGGGREAADPAGFYKIRLSMKKVQSQKTLSVHTYVRVKIAYDHKPIAGVELSVECEDFGDPSCERQENGDRTRDHCKTSLSVHAPHFGAQEDAQQA